MNKEKEILVVKVIDIFTIEDPKGDFMVGYCGNPLCGKPIEESSLICPYCNSPLDWSW